MSRTSHILVSLVLLGIAFFFLADGAVFALQAADPVTGRAKGCYTSIELLMGVTEPTAWIRAAELLVASIIGGMVVVPSVRRFMKNLRRLKVPDDS